MMIQSIAPALALLILAGLASLTILAVWLILPRRVYTAHATTGDPDWRPTRFTIYARSPLTARLIAARLSRKHHVIIYVISPGLDQAGPII